MSRRRRSFKDGDDGETQGLLVLRHHFPALLESWLGGPNQVHVESISIRRRASGVLVVVSAIVVADMVPVVAFGSGPTPWDALKNVSKAIQKSQWKPDRFRKSGWGP